MILGGGGGSDPRDAGLQGRDKRYIDPRDGGPQSSDSRDIESWDGGPWDRENCNGYPKNSKLLECAKHLPSRY